MEHEGAAMYDAATALRDAMIELGLACDGGKDSLSMAASAGGEVCHQLLDTPHLRIVCYTCMFVSPAVKGLGMWQG